MRKVLQHSPQAVKPLQALQHQDTKVKAMQVDPRTVPEAQRPAKGSPSAWKLGSGAQEEEDRAREEEEQRIREEAERQRKLDEQAQRQAQRLREIEERQAVLSHPHKPALPTSLQVPC